MTTFAVSTAEDRSLPPIPFTLTGMYAADTGRTDSWTESFQALGVPPLAVANSMAEAFFLDEATGRRQINPGAVIAFLRDALPGDQARRFMALVHDKDRLVKLDVLVDVMNYLVEKYVGRPTGLPSPSGPGGGSTGHGPGAPAGSLGY